VGASTPSKGTAGWLGSSSPRSSAPSTTTTSRPLNRARAPSEIITGDGTDVGRVSSRAASPASTRCPLTVSSTLRTSVMEERVACSWVSMRLRSSCPAVSAPAERSTTAIPSCTLTPPVPSVVPFGNAVVIAGSSQPEGPPRRPRTIAAARPSKGYQRVSGTREAASSVRKYSGLHEKVCWKFRSEMRRPSARTAMRHWPSRSRTSVKSAVTAVTASV